MIPRCSPDKARIWEAPLSLNASTVCSESRLLSPVMSADIMAFVCRSVKLMLAICSLHHRPASMAYLPIMPMSEIPADNVVVFDVMPHISPVQEARTIRNVMVDSRLNV